jgi:dipeptidyl aminopeptidase/acylaminoacyl peptidase
MVPSDGSAAAMQFTAGGQDSAPRWSPDGARLEFVRAAEKASPPLWTIPGNGGEATRLTNLPEGSLGAWRWSPCGTWIAAAFREQDPQWTTKAVADRKQTGASDPPRVLDHWWYRLDGDGYFNGQRHALYRIEAATGEHRLLYDKDTLGFFTFDVAPDGRHVMVTTETSKRAGLDDCDERLVRIDARSGKATPLKGLPKGCKSNVCYSPDGTMLAWAGRIGPDSTYSTENLELWVSNADGSKATPPRSRSRQASSGHRTANASSSNSAGTASRTSPRSRDAAARSPSTPRENGCAPAATSPAMAACRCSSRRRRLRKRSMSERSSEAR